MIQPSDPHWFSDVEAPLVLGEAGLSSWWRSADVVVIGAGCAGVCGALEAADRGAQVLCVDRFGGGGATELSGGVVYAAATAIQKKARVEDSIEDAFRYLKLEAGDVVSEETLLAFCRESAANIDWLTRKGVIFGEQVFEGKASYPPDDYFLYYSGNEKSKPYCDVARAAQRGHRTVGKGYSGYAFYGALYTALVAHRNIKLVPHSPVRRLVTGSAGEVLGVEVLSLNGVHLWLHRLLQRLFTGTPIWHLSRGLPTAVQRCMAWLENHGGDRKLIRARKGVVLATGGFSHNRSMVDHYAPHLKAYTPLASCGSDGSGIRLGQTVGARTDRLGNFDLGRHLAVNEPYVRGIIVNCDGRRFVGEDQYHATVGDRIAFEQGGVAWIILDQSLYEEAKRRALALAGKTCAIWLNGVLALMVGLKKGRTVEELARGCGLPAAALQSTLTDYAAIARGRQDDPWGKRPELLRPFGSGPYYAVNICSDNRFSPVGAFSLGGLVVSETTSAVISDDGSEITGLYAVGRDAIGIPSNKYVSGTSLADCVFSGRRAGAAVARAEGGPLEANQPPPSDSAFQVESQLEVQGPAASLVGPDKAR